MPITDKYGVQRHTLKGEQLEALYKALENFIGDCTLEEYQTGKEAFTIVKTAVHQRIRDARRQ